MSFKGARFHNDAFDMFKPPQLFVRQFKESKHNEKLELVYSKYLYNYLVSFCGRFKLEEYKILELSKGTQFSEGTLTAILVRPLFGVIFVWYNYCN